MSSTNFTLNILAALNKQLSRKQVKSDLTNMDNSMYVKVIAKLAKTLSQRQLKKDLEQLNDLYVQIRANVKVDNNTKTQLENRIQELQKSLSELEVNLKVSKAKAASEIESVRKEVQLKASRVPVGFDIEVKRSKVIADIEYLGKRFSKLFSNVAAKQKYENILESAYSISDETQLKSVRDQITAFTSELKAAGLASQSLDDKWKNIIERSKNLYSAANIINTIFTQVKQAVSTFLQLDTAMTNLYKQMNTLGSVLQQVKSLPLDDNLRKDALDKVGESTNALTEKNLKLLLSQKQLNEDDQIAILIKHNLTEEEAKAKLQKMGLTTATNAQSAANVTEAASTNALKGAMTSLKASIIGVGTSIKAAFMSNPIGFILTGITTAVSIATTIMSKYKESLDKGNEAMSDAVSEYKSAKSSLENINSELKEQSKKMEELLAKDKLTYAEKGQLEELQAITKELMLQQDIEERRADKASKEAAKKTLDAYKEQYGKYDKTEDKMKEMFSYIYPGISAGKNDVLGNIGEYISATASLEKARADYEKALAEGKDLSWYDEHIQYHIDRRDNRSQILNDNIYDLQEKLLLLEDEYQKAIANRESGLDLTTFDKEVIESYETILNLIRIVHEYTDPNTWKSMQIEKVFDTEGIEKTKEELVEMVKAGTFDENTLQSYPKLSEALEKNKVSASELRNELEALADAEDIVKDGAFNNKEPISLSSVLTKSTDSLDKFQSSVKSAADAYTTLLTGNYSSSELLDSIQAINKAASDMGKSIDWESIAASDNPLKAIQDEIESLSNTYAESVLSEVGTNTNSDFGKILVNIVQEAYKSEAALSSLNTQIDSLETFDWIETAINRIERSISNLNLKASSVYRSWSERNSNLKTELAEVKKEIDIQASGYNQYIQKVASVGLPEEWASKVRNGQIDIDSITDKTIAEQIKQYQNYYEKAIKCQDAVEDLRESVSKLYETAFDNIVTQFDSIVSVIENSKSMIDKQINQAEERGYIANVAYYDALIKVEQKNIEQLIKEKATLESSLADAVNNGAIEEGSKEWADMSKQINDVTLSIEEANTAMIQYGNSIRDIQWQIFDLLQDRISRISSESDFLINLLSNDKQYDDRGQFTDTGMSTVGLHGMNYNVYMAQADKYAQEMLRIDKELAKDPYNLDLAERRQELLELQQEMIIAAEDEKQAIVDMVEEGINLEIDAIQSLASAYADCLDSTKDLYDYQKSLSEQTEEIASLQKQLSAYEGDMSEEARQKVQQIKLSLENAQSQLEESEFDHYLSEQKKLLDSLVDEYSDVLNQRLDNIDALIADMLASSNANAGMISNTLSSKADSVGYYLSESMENIWNTNTGSMLDALAMYDSDVAGGFAEVNTSVGEVIRGVTETVSGIGNVNTTINNAISSVTGNMQAILDKLSSISTMQSSSSASSYYGGNGNTSSSSSSGTGSGSSSSGTSGSSGSGFFIYSKDSYPKNKLNKETSIIDRLRYFDFDYSFSARSFYYGKMGLPGTYTGTSEQNIQMLNWMKLNGYKNGVYNLKRNEWAWTQEGGKPEVILKPDGSITRPDGSVLTPLKQGDSVLNTDATKNLFNFVNNPNNFVRSIGLGNIPTPTQKATSINMGGVEFIINAPNATNWEEIKQDAMKDRQFTKFVQTLTVGEAAGGSSLKKYNI